MADFQERKLKAMAALASQDTDRSRKGGIDAPIATLIGRVNAHPDFFTTSSCSGRITLFSEPCPEGDEHSDTGNENGEDQVQGQAQKKKKKKRKGGDWLLVSHEPVDSHDVISAARRFVENAPNELLVFRFEPFILALECVSISAAQELVACAIGSGFRESGITSIRKRVIIAVRCSIRLEVPVAEKGKLLVSEEYLCFLSLLANHKLEQNKQRTDKFLESFITQFQSGALSSLESVIKVTDDDHFKVGDHREESQCNEQEFQELCSSESSLPLFSARDVGSYPGSHASITEESFQAVNSCSRSVAGWFEESAGRTLQASKLSVSGSPAELLQRWGHSTCTIESGLVIFGGYGGRGRHARLNDILVFDAQNQVLKSLKPATTCPPRMAQTATIINDKIWVIGGRAAPHVLLADVIVIDHDKEDIYFPHVTGDFTPRHRHAAAAVNKNIYVFGGLGAEGVVLDDLLVLDTTAMRWSRLECKGDVPCARHSHTLSAVGQKLYLLGGYDGKNIQAGLHVFDTRDLTWSQVSITGDIPVPRFSHSCTVIGKQQLAVLGGCPTMKQANSLFILDVEDLVWKKVGLSLPSGCLLVRHTANLVGTTLLVIGGGASCYAFGTMFSTSFSADVAQFF